MRRLYGGRPADFTTDADGKPIPGAQLEIWDARHDGNRLLDVAVYQPSNPGTPGPPAVNGYFPSQPDGTTLIWGPEDFEDALYVAGRDLGGGQRWILEPVLADRIAQLEAEQFQVDDENREDGYVLVWNEDEQVHEYVSAPAGNVASVNGQDGTVVLDATHVGAIPAAAAGANDGVATLNSSGRLPLAQAPELEASHVGAMPVLLGGYAPVHWDAIGGEWPLRPVSVPAEATIAWISFDPQAPKPPRGGGYAGDFDVALMASPLPEEEEE